MRKTATVDLEKSRFYSIACVHNFSRAQVSLYHGQHKSRTKDSCRFWLPLRAELSERRSRGLRNTKGSNGPKRVLARSSCSEQSSSGMNLTSLAYIDTSCLEQSCEVVQTECSLLAGAPPLCTDWMQIQAAGSRPISSCLSKYYICLSEKHFLVTAQHI